MTTRTKRAQATRDVAAEVTCTPKTKVGPAKESPRVKSGVKAITSFAVQRIICMQRTRQQARVHRRRRWRWTCCSPLAAWLSTEMSDCERRNKAQLILAGGFLSASSEDPDRSTPKTFEGLLPFLFSLSAPSSIVDVDFPILEKDLRAAFSLLSCLSAPMLDVEFPVFPNAARFLSPSMVDVDLPAPANFARFASGAAEFSTSADSDLPNMAKALRHFSVKDDGVVLSPTFESSSDPCAAPRARAAAAAIIAVFVLGVA
mmetsp:Transcript_94987/g.273406  ORF Transcript_94987/g.273406 Transcript_94987/m.273406 type:complete len:259 (-) Transcript_94987:675-1451(-)